MLRRTVLFAITAVAALASPSFAQTTYRVVDLGLLPNTIGCQATAINAAGDVAGFCDDGGVLTETPFLWRHGQLTALPKLKDGNNAAPNYLTLDGTVVGSADDGNFQPHAYMVRNGVAIEVESSGGQNSHALGIDNRGVIFGSYAKGLSGNVSSWSPVTYTEDPRKPGRFRRAALPLVPGGDLETTGGYVSAANSVGEAVGEEFSALFGQRGLFWANDTAHTISLLEPTVTGGYGTVAMGMNDFGVAVGGSIGPSVYERAALWQNDAAHTPVDLGALPGDNASVAYGINNVGQVIGYSYLLNDPQTSVTETHPFVWENGSLFDIRTRLDASAAGWTIGSLSAINDSGAIAASGVVGGVTHAILLLPN